MEGVVMSLAVGLDDLLELGIAVGIGILRAVLIIDYLEGDVLARQAFSIFGDSGFEKATLLLVWFAVSVRTAEDAEELLICLGQEFFVRVFTLIGSFLIDIDGGAADVKVAAELALGGALRKFTDNDSEICHCRFVVCHVYSFGEWKFHRKDKHDSRKTTQFRATFRVAHSKPLSVAHLKPICPAHFIPLQVAHSFPLWVAHLIRCYQLDKS